MKAVSCKECCRRGGKKQVEMTRIRRSAPEDARVARVGKWRQMGGGGNVVFVIVLGR